MVLEALLIFLILVAVVYTAAVSALAVAGRGTDARALARFLPDCVVLAHRLIGDPRVPRSAKVYLALVGVYIALPFDLVPDFIPIAGQLDDTILFVLIFRYLLRRSGPAILAEHWPGPVRGLELALRLAYRPGG